jgi:predicted membrane-bound spermidine synthase
MRTKPGLGTARVEKIFFVSPAMLLMAAFLEGASVMAVELLGAKMLAAFFGNSLLLWTSVIGVTLGLLALGYFIGGKLSRKKDALKIMMWLFATGSLSIAIMPVWAHSIFSFTGEFSIHAGSVTAAFLLLAIPLISLGAASPIIIRKMTNDLNAAGAMAGNAFALSTLGGVFATFFTGFFLLPNTGIVLPVFCLSLILIAFAYYISLNNRLIFLLPVLLFIGIINFSEPKKGQNAGFKVRMVSEGLLGQLKVADHVEPSSGFPMRMLLINGVPQTYSFLINDTAYSKWFYVHRAAILASLKKGSSDVLLFGFGGGSLASELNYLNMKVDAVEIDERMFDVAKKYFYFDAALTNFIVDDARHYIRKATKKYDLIVFDVLNGEAQPSYLFTQQAFDQLKEIIKPDGLIIIVFQEKDVAPGHVSAFKSISNTLLNSGFNTWYAKEVKDVVNDILIVASPGDTDFSNLNLEDLRECCVHQPWDVEGFIRNPVVKLKEPFSEGIILSDDKPSLDHLNAETIKEWRKTSINQYINPELRNKKKLFN